MVSSEPKCYTSNRIAWHLIYLWKPLNQARKKLLKSQVWLCDDIQHLGSALYTTSVKIDFFRYVIVPLPKNFTINRQIKTLSYWPVGIPSQFLKAAESEGFFKYFLGNKKTRNCCRSHWLAEVGLSTIKLIDYVMSLVFRFRSLPWINGPNTRLK